MDWFLYDRDLCYERGKSDICHVSEMVHVVSILVSKYLSFSFNAHSVTCLWLM